MSVAAPVGLGLVEPEGQDGVVELAVAAIRQAVVGPGGGTVMSWDEEEPDEEKRLVCGVCERMLPDTYDGQRAAEEAADEHERAEHPDRDQVVVVPVSTKLVAEEGADDMVETAKGAQRRLD